MPRHATRPIDRTLVRLLVWRLFLPTMLLFLIAFLVAGASWNQTEGAGQRQLAGSLAYTVDAYLEQAGRVLGSMADYADTPGAGNIEPLLNATWRGYGYFSTLYRSDAKGLIIALAPSDSQFMGLDISGHPYFDRARQTAKPTISDPFTSPRTGKPTVFMALPLSDDGLLVGELNLDSLQNAIDASLQDAGTGEVYVVDGAGLLLAHRNPSLVARQTNLGSLDIVKLGLKKNATDYYRDQGTLMLGSTALIAPTGWLVVVQSPLQRVFAPFLAASIPAVVLTLAVWALLVWTFRRRFTRLVSEPLAHLAAISADIADGDIEISAKVERDDEIGRVAEAFNTMADRLRRRLRIENLVADISRNCINLSIEDTNAAVTWALESVGRLAGADRSWIFQYDKTANTIRNTHEWRLGEAFTRLDTLQTLPAGAFPWLMEKMHRHETVLLSDIADLPEEAKRERRIWQTENIRSLVCVPLLQGGALHGFWGLDAIEKTRDWAEVEGRLLRVVGEVVVSALERYRVEFELSRESEINASMAELSRKLLSPASPAEISELVLEEAVRLTQSRNGFAGFFDPQSGEFVCPALHGEEWAQCGEKQAGGRFSPGDRFWRRVFAERKSLLSNTPDKDPRFGEPPKGRPPVRRLLAAPSLVDRRLVGQLALADAERDYTARDLALLERVAVMYAMALTRKHSETDLASLNRKLEGIVTERTADLAAKAVELKAANERLMELDVMKSAFLSSVSHELRTPLTSVMGFAKLIRKDFTSISREAAQDAAGKKAGRIRDNLDIIYGESERLTRLINDVLDISKIESGRMAWNDKIISLEDCVNAALRPLAERIEHSPAAFRTDLEGNLPPVTADPDRMQQVFLNLLDNAIKFTAEGEVAIAARALGDMIRITVSDTGIGIPETDLEKIFDKFHQTSRNDTLTEKPMGTGLGLAICHQIITHYGGDIRAESEIGRGTVFTIHLPVSPVDEHKERA